MTAKMQRGLLRLTAVTEREVEVIRSSWHVSRTDVPRFPTPLGPVPPPPDYSTPQAVTQRGWEAGTLAFTAGTWDSPSTDDPVGYVVGHHAFMRLIRKYSQRDGLYPSFIKACERARQRLADPAFGREDSAPRKRKRRRR